MIREIKPDDIPNLIAMGTKYDCNFDKLYNLQEYINNPIYLLYGYEKCGILVGFIIATRVCEVIEILIIFVEADFRSQGIATNLINKLTNYQHEKILLEVSVENINAYNLYKKLGFEVINHRKKYYHGIDGLVMERKN